MVYRIARALLTLWLVVTSVFVVLRLSGDPAQTMLGPDAPAAALDAFRENYGLDNSIVRQYLEYIGQLLQGNLG